MDIRNRLVCFDIKGLGKNLKKPGMLIVQDAVWNTVTINRAIGRSTWYFMDEFHLLLFFNNVILPFADDFPKDTELYKLLTTKSSEAGHAKADE